MLGYTSVADANLTYDAAGSLTKDRQGYEYEYDYENRIVKITKAGQTKAEFAYDALGRRIEKKDLVDPNNTRRYYYNYNWQSLCQYDANGVIKEVFVYGNYIDEVLFMVPFFYIYIHDHLYDIVALVHTNGNVLERYEYDAYGNPTIWNADFTTERDSSNYGNPYLFTGRRVDIVDSGSLKIQYNRNRHYDYYSGRWLTHDPLGITPNAQWTNKWEVVEQYVKGLDLYEYVNSRPTNSLDPEGLLGAMPDPWPPDDPVPTPVIPPTPIFTLTDICDKYSCKKCCDVGITYGAKERMLCRLESYVLSMRYMSGIMNYWATLPWHTWYTECQEYVIVIMDDIKPAQGLKFFSLYEGGYRTWIGGEHHYVGVFHACNREKFFGSLVLPDTSDATLDPWVRGMPPYIYNKYMGDATVQPGRTSQYPWVGRH